MLKHIRLSILVLVIGSSSWGQDETLTSEQPATSVGGIPPITVVQDDLDVPSQSSVRQQPDRAANQRDAAINRYWYAKKDDNTIVSPPEAVPAFITAVAPQEELKIVTRRLQAPVPEDLIGMVDQLLGPDGEYRYEDQIRLLVMRGSKEDLLEAEQFIEDLCNYFQEALDEELEKSQRQPVQIEAVLMIGRKVADRVVSAKETNLRYDVPAEIAHVGLGEADLLPFAFGEVEVVGRAVLHTDLPPSHLIPDPVETYLAGHRIEFSLYHRPGEPGPDYPVIGVSVSYEEPKETFASQSAKMVGRLTEGTMQEGGVDNAAGGDFGRGYGMTGASSGRSMGMNSELGRGRGSMGMGGYGSSDDLFDPRPRRPARPSRGGGRQVVGMTSEPKLVFDRPILVGSYKPKVGETAILAIRLTPSEE